MHIYVLILLSANKEYIGNVSGRIDMPYSANALNVV